MNNFSPETPVTVDYTGRDFYALREALIARVKARVTDWYGTNPNDFGLALVEAMAYVGDVLGYYIDRVANENSILTASQRSSILALAKSYGYTPSGYRSAFATIRVANSSGSVVYVPEGAQVAGEYADGDVVRNVVFTTLAEAVVPANGFVDLDAFHGEDVSLRFPAVGATDVAGETIAISTGEPDQTYFLSETQVVVDSIRVFVQNGSSYGQWGIVPYLVDYGPSDAVCRVDVDAENNVSIIFGDGVSGAIPNAFATIKVQYVVGGGVEGNIPENTLNRFVNVPGLTSAQTAALVAPLTVTNISTGIGGADPESDDLIRVAAPQAFSTSERAVTLKDFEGIALLDDSVAKAKAVASQWTSVTVYVAPSRVSTATDPYPLYDDSNTTLTLEWSTLQSGVAEELELRKQIGVSVTVSPPTYIPVTCAVKYTLDPRYSAANVEASLESALMSAFSYNNNSFGQVITPEEVEATLRQVPGTLNVRVTQLFRTSASSNARDILVGQPGEIFTFLTANTTISASSTDARLVSLVASTGSLTPVFDDEFYSYTLIVGTGVTTLNLTPTVGFPAGARLSVNGTTVTSGAATAVATPTATTPVSIVVVAEDGVTRNTYNISIIKA